MCLTCDQRKASVFALSPSSMNCQAMGYSLLQSSGDQVWMDVGCSKQWLAERANPEHHYCFWQGQHHFLLISKQCLKCWQVLPSQTISILPSNTSPVLSQDSVSSPRLKFACDWFTGSCVSQFGSLRAYGKEVFFLVEGGAVPLLSCFGSYWVKIECLELWQPI